MDPGPSELTAVGLAPKLPGFFPAVFKDSFFFVLVSPSPGVSGGESGGWSGLSFSLGCRGFLADSGPDPGGGSFFPKSGLKCSWILGSQEPHLRLLKRACGRFSASGTLPPTPGDPIK